MRWRHIDDAVDLNGLGDRRNRRNLRLQTNVASRFGADCENTFGEETAQFVAATSDNTIAWIQVSASYFDEVARSPAEYQRLFLISRRDSGLFLLDKHESFGTVTND